MSPTVGLIQIFTNQSHMSLNAGFFVFHLLHTNLVNISGEVRRQHISQGRKMTTYLPVLFETCREVNEFEKVAPSPSSQKQI